MSRVDLLQQWVRHRDGALDGAEEAELLRGLEADPEARRIVLADSGIDSLLRSRVLDPERGERFTAGVAALLAAEGDHGRFAARMQARLGRTQRLRRAARTRRWGILALAAGLAAAACWWWLGQGAEEADLPRCLPGGRIAAVGERLAADSPLELRWNDGSSLRLDPGATVTVGDPVAGKNVGLDHGRVVVSAAHQPEGRPLRVVNRHATATVVGTEFALAADQRRLRLEVDRGAVRLASGDGAGLLVSAGGIGLADRFGVRGAGAPVFAWDPGPAAPEPFSGLRRTGADGVDCLEAVTDPRTRVAGVAFRSQAGLFEFVPGGTIVCRVWIGADVGWAGFYVQDFDNHHSGQWHLPLDRRGQWLDLRLPLAAVVPARSSPPQAGDLIHFLLFQALPATSHAKLAQVQVVMPAEDGGR